MKRYFGLILVLLLLCCRTVPSISDNEFEYLDNADQLIIYIYREWSNPQNAKKYIFNASKEICSSKLISKKSIHDFLKCGYTGEINILKNGKSLLNSNMTFNIDCKNVVLEFDGKVYSQYLTEEAVLFIRSLEQIEKK